MRRLLKRISIIIAASLVVTSFAGAGSFSALTGNAGAYGFTSLSGISGAGGFASLSGSTVSAKAKLAAKKITIKVGEKKKIAIKSKAKGSIYTFKSSKKKVATVNAKGVVKGKKAGSAKITVTEKNTKTKKLAKIGVVKVKVTKKAAQSGDDGSSGNGSNGSGKNGNGKNGSNGTGNNGNNGSSTNPGPSGTDGSGTNNGTGDGTNGSGTGNNGGNQNPNPTPDPTPEPTPDVYTTELFSVYVDDTTVESVDGNTCKVDMQFFNGASGGDFFNGTILGDKSCDVIKTYKETGEVVHHARYILTGTDDRGESCRIFVEDLSIGVTDDMIITKPIFITNSKSLAFIETADIQGRVTEDEAGNKTVTYMWNESNTEPVPFREVHMPDSSKNYTKELFTFSVAVGNAEGVDGANGSASMIYFGGSSSGSNFNGSLAASDADTRLQYKGTIQTLSARYILSGTTADGTPTRIYVENNGIDNNGMVTEPTLITDNPNLAYIESAPLHGTVTWDTGLTIHFWTTP